MKYITLVFALGILVSALTSSPVFAATATASFSVTATVVSSCQVSTTATASGTYAVTRANVATSVSVACTNPTPYNVSYSTELAPSVSVTTRKTAGSASDSPGHVPFSDSAHTGIWDRTADAGTVAGTGSGSFQLYAGYGQSARAQHVAPGAFADTVTVTITY